MKTNTQRLALMLGMAFLLTSLVSAQSFKWSGHYNSSGSQVDYSMAVTTDGSGNVYVTGIANNGSQNDRKIITRKYTSTGGIAWTATQDNALSGSCAIEAGYAIAVDANNYVWVLH